MSKTSVSQFSIGDPVGQLPPRANGYGAASPMWLDIAERVEALAGNWVPVNLPGRTRKSIAATVRHIKTGKSAAFRDGAWDAAMRGDTLYIRSIPTTELKEVTK